MKVVTQVQLESKEVRKALALFFGVDEKQVIPMKYGFALDGITEEEIKRRLGADDGNK